MRSRRASAAAKSPAALRAARSSASRRTSGGGPVIERPARTPLGKAALPGRAEGVEDPPVVLRDRLLVGSDPRTPQQEPVHEAVELLELVPALLGRAGD